jgi:hypothetical protein
MKLTKKLFIAALAVAGLTFAGCNMNEDKYGIIDFNAPGNRAETNFTNDTGSMQRAWKTFNSNHRLGSCVITLDKSNGNGGNMGFIWGLEDGVEEGTCNFYVATLNYGNQTNGNNFGYYVSYFTGVGKAYLEGSTGNFCDKNGIELGKSGCTATETQIKGSPWASLSSINSTGKVAFVLSWEQNTGYKMALYEDATAPAVGTGTKYVSEFTIAAGLSDTEKQSDKAPDKGMGVYAMSNPGKTLHGTWDFPGFTATSNINEIPE